jgi:8-oxo-dGTP pyrophosphatase MutT (NUDIX family)
VPLPDPASTVILLRPSSTGFEVLMVQRNAVGFFGSIVVFPGGKVEDVDVPVGLTPGDDRSHRNAAIRELAEETGILLTSSGAVVAPDAKGEQFYSSLAGKTGCGASESLVLVSRWVTPEFAPRRFDTRFYLVGCDSSPEIRIDADELVGFDWVTPSDGLARFEDGAWPMIYPTISHLRWLQRRTSIADAIDSARGADGRTMIQPRRVDDGSLLPIHLPGDQW